MPHTDQPAPVSRTKWQGSWSPLPLRQWPTTDQQAWLRACAPAASLLDEERGGASGWRPASREAVQRAYSHWLGFLQHQAPLQEEEPAVRLMPERVQAFATSLRDNRSWRTVAGYLGHLAMAAKVLGPDRDWAWLRIMRGIARSRATPVRQKAARLIEPSRLLQLGRSLMEKAASARSAGTAARRYRDGLMIAFLALLPLRRRNLMGLDLEQQLTRQTQGWMLTVPGEQTKNHRPIEMAVPSVLVPMLETYLAQHRPVLATGCSAGGTPKLWLGGTGKPLSGQAVWKIITRHTQRHLGVAVNPHLFRDCAASFLGEADPEHVRLAAPLLGHTSFTTTERHYITAHARTALRKHHQNIQFRRDPLRRRRVRPEDL